MRVCFTAKATAFNQNTQFPDNVINTVVVSNHDMCTYQCINGIENGTFNVDFVLKPNYSNVDVRDSLKFHFYTGEMPVVVAAGEVPMACIAKTMSEPSHRANYTYSCNFNSTNVHLQFTPCTVPMNVVLPKMVPSALKMTSQAVKLFSVMAKGVSTVLNQNVEIDSQKGASMFTNLLTSHNMENQLTTHIHFQRDVTPTSHDSIRFLESGLSMTAVAEALHSQCMTAEQVMLLPTESDTFTLFVSAVCQSFTRSAHLCPYVSDMVMDDRLDSAGQVKFHLSESFKLPFREPFSFSTTQAKLIHGDDCDGHATFNLHAFTAFGHLHANVEMKRDAALLNGKTIAHDEDYLAMYFPAHQFNMTHSQKQSVFNVALKIGELIRLGILECHVLLLAAGAPSLGGKETGEIGGHAANLIANFSNKQCPREFLMEGTNSIQADVDARTISIDAPGGKILMSLVQVANLLTKEIAGKNFSEADSRFVLHVDNKTSEKFYRTGFCQNGTLLATATPNNNLSYGLCMQRINDYSVKVLMPVNKGLLNTLVQNERATEFLDSFVEMRQQEIHPPPVATQTIIDATMAWSAVTAYEAPAENKGRDFKVCLASTSFREPEMRQAGLYRALAVASEWNANVQQKQIGHMTAYEAFDSVFTRLCLWTDNTEQLEAALGHAMAKSFA
jgi:hypothetical protein